MAIVKYSNRITRLTQSLIVIVTIHTIKVDLNKEMKYAIMIEHLNINIVLFLSSNITV